MQRAFVALCLSVLQFGVFALAGCSDATAPASSELAFASQPESLAAGERLAPPVAVAIRDEDGRTIVDWTQDVSLTLEGASASLGGTTTRTPLSGTAIFDDLEVTATGAGYRLVARSGGLIEAVSEPFDVHAVFRTAALTAGSQHTCALLADGAAYCWGSNGSGQLGTGDHLHRAMPTRVATDIRFVSLTAFGAHTCGLATDGSAYCWGSNVFGELGDGTREDRALPRRVDLPGPVAMVDAGYWHGCALLEAGDAYCWGDNWGGALGIGVADSLRTTPVRVIGDHDWAMIETGYMQSCGLTHGGVAYCWGPNVYGENGTGDQLVDVYAPTTPVVGDHRFTDLVAGGGPCHGETCGVDMDGRVLCWGKNYQRDTGGSSERFLTRPTPIADDPGLVDVTVGPSMICGFTEEGGAYCIGDAVNRMFPPTRTPVQLAPDLTVASVALGNGHTCVVTAGGEAYCWGDNDSGQLGSGTASLGWAEPRAVWAPDG